VKVDLHPAVVDRPGELIPSPQVGSLVDRRIAQLDLGGHGPGPRARARKLIGMRYRQALSELRMDLSEGRRRGAEQAHARLPQRPLPDHCQRHRTDPAHAGRERLLRLPR
jgi:hypothetical protein